MAESLESMLNQFFEHFQCAICISTFKSTYITKNCAHRFCEDCIKECINTLHRCPLCNRDLDSIDEIVKDAQFDNLICKSLCFGTKILKKIVNIYLGSVVYFYLN